MTNNEQPGSRLPDPATPRAPEPQGHAPQPAPAGPDPGATYPPQATPGQPGAGQPYPGPQQPYAGQPYPGPQYPGQPYPPQGYGADPGAPQPPYGVPPVQPRRSSVPLMIGIGTGVLVIALVAVFALTRGTNQASGPGGLAVVASDPSGAVQGYLEALARGDADAALAHAATPPTNTILLTDEVLASSLQVAPITDIRVDAGTVSGDNASVQAIYQLGDDAVSTTIPVRKVESRWLLGHVAATVKRATLPRVALTAGGVPLEHDDVILFPGHYPLASADSRYEVTDATLFVPSPTDRPILDEQTYISLTSEGTNAVRAAAQKKLASCLKQKSLKPSGCAFGTKLSRSYHVVASSIRWKVTKGADAMKKLKPGVDPSDPTSVGADTVVRVKATFRTTNGYSWYAYSGFGWVDARITDDQVSVTFG